MSEMKDSGVEWIGEIPKEWEIEPIGTLFDEITERNKDGNIKIALQFTYGNIVRKSNFNVEEDAYAAKTILSYTVVDSGTIILNGLNLNYDFVTQRVGIVKECGAITSAYIAFKPKDVSYMLSEYAAYLFKSYDNCKAFHNMGGGVRTILTFNELKHYNVLVPAISEQRKIVSALDHDCNKINSILTDIQAQIETLKQYKQSLITETVMKGLDSDVEMKDSGVEWIGEIPYNWNISRAKYIFNYHKKIVGKNADDYERLALTMHGVIKRSKDDDSGLQPEKFETYQILNKRELVFKLIDLENTSTSRVGLSHYTGIVSPAYIIISSNGEVLPEYAEKWFLSMWYRNIFNYLGDAGVRSGLNTGNMLEIPVAFPSLQTQFEISTFLDSLCNETDALISEKQSQLDILSNYMQSMIYEYVTGKKDARI